MLIYGKAPSYGNSILQIAETPLKINIQIKELMKSRCLIHKEK